MNKLLIPAALLLLACNRSSDGSAVTFGAAGPWKEAYGAMDRKGVELAQEEINARESWKSHPLKILFEDDRGDGAQATRVAQRFIDSTSALAVIGHVNSGAMVSAAHVYDGHMAAIATSATSPTLTGISPWAFRVISSDSANGARIARFTEQLGGKRVALLYENNPYGRGIVDAFRRAYTGEIVSVDPMNEGGNQQIEPFVTYYKRLRPDVIFVAGTGESGLPFLKEARRQNIESALIGGDGWTDVVVDTALSEGIYVAAPFSAEDKRPEAERFVAAFRRKFGITPDGNAASAYDATMLLAQAYQDGARDRKSIRDYLAKLETPFPGVTGPIRFADGDPVQKGIVMTRVHRGALQVVEGGR